jgi:hypothetical protein
MKVRLVLILALLFTLMVGRSVTAQNARARVSDYFPLRVGDSWTYRHSEDDSEFTVKVLSAEKQPDGTMLYLVEKQAGAVIHSWYSKSGGWTLLHREAYQEQEGISVKYEPPREFLKNPLIAGAKWTWKGIGINKQSASESNQVVGAEVVKVPAGRFRAMKVVSKVSDGETAVTKTYWYAAGVGLIKSMTTSRPLEYGWELVSYSFKKASAR